MKFAASILLLAFAFAVTAKPIEVDPSRAVIVLPSGALERIRSGAADLRKHLKIMTGVNVPLVQGKVPEDGRYAFCVGIREPGAKETMAVEEARWIIGEKAAYFYGDDRFSRRGSEFAVMNFLDSQLGIKWIEPGDDGIVCRRSAMLNLQTGSYQWIPKLLVRCVRLVDPKKGKIRGLEKFNLTEKEYQMRQAENRRWQYRMLCCPRSDSFVFGHAFTKWWSRYGKTHPEYFALNKFGKRAPIVSAGNPDDPVAVGASARTVKLCWSNPDLVKQVMAEYLAKKPRPPYINVCENDDAGGYCRCPACLALDTVKNQDLDSANAQLSDRYFHFVNAVAKEAAKYGAVVTAYAYNDTKMPPKREKIAPNVILGTVPTFLDLKELDDYYAGWKKMGAVRFTIRPNYHWCLMHTGIPMGLEKHFFDILEVAIRNGAVGADFDAGQCSWSLNGITDYILCRKLAHPEKTFEELEKEYLSAFGAAAGDAGEYFRYDRNEIFRRRLLPEMKEILRLGRFGNFARGVIWNLKKYYTTEDFDRTDAILKKAAAKKLTETELRRVKRLQKANRHARLLFLAVTAGSKDRIAASVDLLNWRLANRNTVKLNYLNLFRSERSAGCTEIDSAIALRDFSEPYLPTPLLWYALTDENNEGLRKNWQKLDFSAVRSRNQLLPTNSPWEKISPKFTEVTPEFREKMKNYDGVVWYFQQLNIPKEWRGSRISLCFGAVDESCELFVNGRKAGEHPFVQPDDWCKPFSIRIDPYVNWENAAQDIAVRVTDSHGSGGIWKRVWLVHK